MVIINYHEFTIHFLIRYYKLKTYGTKVGSLSLYHSTERYESQYNEENKEKVE